MAAQVDTRPKAGDRLRAPLAGSAVRNGCAPTHPTQSNKAPHVIALLASRFATAVILGLLPVSFGLWMGIL